MVWWIWRWRARVARRSWGAQERHDAFLAAQSQEAVVASVAPHFWEVDLAGQRHVIERPRVSAALEMFLHRPEPLEYPGPELSVGDLIEVRLISPHGAAEVYLDALAPPSADEIRAKLREANSRLAMLLFILAIGLGVSGVAGLALFMVRP